MRRSALLAIVACALVTTPAGAATTLGSTATAANSTCSSGTAVWELDPADTVPAGGGVVTSMATTSPSATGEMTFKIIRDTTVIGTSTPLTLAAGLNRVAVRIPVNGGESLGMWENNAPCSVGSSGSLRYVSGTTDPPVGTTFAVPSTSTGIGLAVQATLEPDADHDGFGDETQDSCPTDPAVHSGACTADLGLAQSVMPTTIGVGDVAVATVALTNNGPGDAAGTSLGVTTTPGLQVVATIPSAGCTFAPALSCALGVLAGAAGREAAVVVKGIAVGTQTVTSSATTSSTDPNAANNSASSTVTVEQREPVSCTVPKLTGLTKAFASTLLEAVHCKLGKATRKRSSKGRRGTVIAQSKKAGTTLPVGSKVGVTLKK